MVDSRTTIFIPEISDYELRRELIRAGLQSGIGRLDSLKRELRYLPLTTATMLRAAQLWAAARNRGRPTADSKELDGDVILAAQAERVRAIVATDNVSHLSRFIEARRWEDIV
jgi:predicted nucleic acid-binding protein